MSDTSQPQLPPVRYANYTTFQWQIVTDKTGTMYQTLNGDIGAGTPWGLRVWRIAPNSKAELIYFLEQGNGILWPDPVTKKLYLYCTQQNRSTFYIHIEGYIHPADCPNSDIVNVDETQVASLKQSIATAQGMATAAGTVANQSNKIAQEANAKSDIQAKQIAQLQQQVDALQAQVSQLLTPSQVADLVWQKIKDINYLYRLGFNAWPIPAPDPDIRMYIYDLVALIKKVIKP